jgi:hypothetical protein
VSENRWGASWLAAFVVAALLAIADTHMPHILGWLLNSSVILGVSYAVARWKRALAAWACFYALAALCALNGILAVFTSWLDGTWSTGTQIMAWLLVGCWYWLLQAPRRHLPEPPQVSHVVHHHLVHDAAADWTAGAPVIDGQVIGRELPRATPPKALEAATRASAFLGRRGRTP